MVDVSDPCDLSEEFVVVIHRRRAGDHLQIVLVEPRLPESSQSFHEHRRVAPEQTGVRVHFVEDEEIGFVDERFLFGWRIDVHRPVVDNVRVSQYDVYVLLEDIVLR
ncbi:hypothetical protein VB779_06705 [Haloarculaceae archaeon H-GB11]|nr:hypothetical protein [Haloarculaceae archaeon H-GB11]